jgi:CheY-like chemotaxis protein
MEGFQVGSAVTLAECLEQAKSGAWDVVVLDIMMPVGDQASWADTDPIDAGLELLRRWRAGEIEGLAPDIPIVILTATTRHRDEIESMGVSAYLEKPASLREVISAVRAAAGEEVSTGD